MLTDLEGFENEKQEAAIKIDMLKRCVSMKHCDHQASANIVLHPRIKTQWLQPEVLQSTVNKIAKREVGGSNYCLCIKCSGRCA
jgi:hypothetical protein